MRVFHSLHKKQGFLLLELLISLLVLMVLMQLLLPLLINARNQALNKTRLLDQEVLKSALVDHFQSQLSPIFWRGCDNASVFEFEIGPWDAVLPARISHKTLVEKSDWLTASLKAVCSYPIEMTSLTPSVAFSCDWDAGDEVIFSSCEGASVGVINEVSSNATEFSFGDDELLNQSGFVYSVSGFSWYLAPGKSDLAFWRTPSLSGNSLELWDGIQIMSIYPLLDEDLNGTWDALDTRYGRYSTTQLKGLWFELLVSQGDCNQQAQSIQADYVNQRGVTWSYHPRCEFVISFVVN